jgi:uridine phosphorylase
MSQFANSELILNPDGSIYHLNLLPDEIATTIITVGDPDRVAEVSAHFDRIELKKGKREFITHTGYLAHHRVSVISTGIGTDNIDIVLNELDALVNIDFNTRTEKPSKTSLNIIRVGTSGSLQESIPVDSILVSEYAIGLDTLMHFYHQSLTLEEEHFKRSVVSFFDGLTTVPPYITAANNSLKSKIAKGLTEGITVTAPGFYAPQGRHLRARGSKDNIIRSLQNFNYNGKRITNLEMETAGIYALANTLGHRALSINAILANRVNGEFSLQPQKTINHAIKLVLGNLF